jgi:hypothetical protein
MRAIDKKSYVIPYADIQEIRLHDSRWNSELEVILFGRMDTHRHFVTNKAQCEHLSTILPSIPELRGKLSKG